MLYVSATHANMDSKQTYAVSGKLRHATSAGYSETPYSDDNKVKVTFELRNNVSKIAKMTTGGNEMTRWFLIPFTALITSVMQ